MQPLFLCSKPYFMYLQWDLFYFFNFIMTFFSRFTDFLLWSKTFAFKCIDYWIKTLFWNVSSHAGLSFPRGCWASYRPPTAAWWRAAFCVFVQFKQIDSRLPAMQCGSVMNHGHSQSHRLLQTSNSASITIAGNCLAKIKIGANPGVLSGFEMRGKKKKTK